MRDAKKHGYGVLVHENGDKYEGQFANDEIDGYGVLWLKSGERKEGLFRKGKHVKGPPARARAFFWRAPNESAHNCWRAV